MMDTVVRKLIELEGSIRQQLLAGAVRLGDDQMPDIWASRRPRRAWTSTRSGSVSGTSRSATMAIGSKSPMVVLNSGTVSLMDEHELRTVLGRGRSASCPTTRSGPRSILLMIGMADGAAVLHRPAAAGGQARLLEWFRAAGFSCDRAATLVNRSPMTTCQTLMVMAGRCVLAQAQPGRVRQAG